MSIRVRDEISVTKTYSLTVPHIQKVAEMAERLNISQGEVVRRAIDILWAQSENTGEIPMKSATAEQ